MRFRGGRHCHGEKELCLDLAEDGFDGDVPDCSCGDHLT